MKNNAVIAFIPDPDENATDTSAAEGVVVEAVGNVYGAEIGPRAVKRDVNTGVESRLSGLKGAWRR